MSKKKPPVDDDGDPIESVEALCNACDLGSDGLLGDIEDYLDEKGLKQDFIAYAWKIHNGDPD